jgi:CubicO group peptidase (beta-lactamase class C family)
VAESVKTHTTLNANSGYGYESWWTLPLDGYYYAAGLYGQRIYVMEDQDMVVVVTASLPEDNQTETRVRRIAQYAIESCR